MERTNKILLTESDDQGMIGLLTLLVRLQDSDMAKSPTLDAILDLCDIPATIANELNRTVGLIERDVATDVLNDIKPHTDKIRGLASQSQALMGVIKDRVLAYDEVENIFYRLKKALPKGKYAICGGKAIRCGAFIEKTTLDEDNSIVVRCGD